jgi:hypothetical protein
MTADQQVSGWGAIICIALALGSFVLLWLVSLFLKKGFAGFGGRYRNAVVFYRKDDPLGYWFAVGIHALGCIYCGYMAYKCYCKFVITPHGFIDTWRLFIGY